MNFNFFTNLEVKILGKITGKTPSQIWLDEFELTKKQDKTWQKLRQKLQKGVPLDYLLGQIQLQNGLKLKIDQNVLIPRPETEFWLEIMIKTLQKQEIENKKLKLNLEENNKNNFEKLESQNKIQHEKEKNEPKAKQILIKTLEQNSGKTRQKQTWQNKLQNEEEKEKKFQKEEILVEIGCGSGLISLTLSPYFERIIAIDKSAKALKIAKKNSAFNNIKNIDFQRADLLNIDLSFLENKSWVLVANLPYLPTEDLQIAVENKVNFEPKMALYSGKDGLNCFKNLVKLLVKIKHQKLPKKFNISKIKCKTNLQIDQINKLEINNKTQNKTKNLQNSTPNSTPNFGQNQEWEDKYLENNLDNLTEIPTMFWQNLKLPNEIWLELDPRNIKLAKRLINSQLQGFYQSKILKDYNHLERVLVCKKNRIIT